MWFLLAATAMQAFSSIQQGQAQAADERQNEAISRHNALLAERDARAKEVALQEDSLLGLFEREQAIGSARVRQGASGARTDVGAPFKERAQLGSMLDFMRFRKARDARAGIEDSKQEAASFRARAKQFGERAKNATKAGFLGAGSDILGGVASGVKQEYWGGGGSGGGSTSARTAGGSFGSTTRANYGNRLR